MIYNPDKMPAHLVTGDLFKYFHYRSGHPFPMHMNEHTFYEMYLCLSGNVSCFLEGRTYELHPNDILLISSGDVHSPAASHTASPYECVIIWFNDDFFSHLKSIGKDLMACFRHSRQKNCRLFHPDQTNLKRLQAACSSIEQELAGDSFGRHVLTYSSVIEILVLLNRAYFEAMDTPYEDVTENKLINQILVYINEHIADHLTLESIAAKFFISKNHLSHQFKLFTGLPPYQYIKKRRLQIAYSMLCNGASVTDACEKCGYNDYSNFLKAFRREYRKNPSDIRKRYL